MTKKKTSTKTNATKTAAPRALAKPRTGTPGKHRAAKVDAPAVDEAKPAEDLTYTGMKPKGDKWTPAEAGMTMAQMSDGYVASLEAAGKSLGTMLSYRIDLKVAVDELGTDTALRTLTAERVAEYFACDRVTKTRTGVLKADVTVKKTCRVLRQALEWAQSAGHVEVAPLPVAQAA